VRRWSCLSVLAACLGLIACSPGGGAEPGNARLGGSVVVGIAASPDSLDPALASSPEALQALWLVHTAPVTYRRAQGAAGTELVPGLARALPEASQDGLTYRFTFRSGLRYSTGRRLRASDFERGIQRALRLSPRRALESFGDIAGARDYARGLVDVAGAEIEGISADGRTGEVRIGLVRPDPSFPETLASPAAAPVPVGTPLRERSDDPPAGIGPYAVARPRGRAAFTLVRVRSFELDGVPAGNVDKIGGRVIADAGARARAALEGRVDVMEGRPPRELLPEIRGENQRRYREDATLAVSYLALDSSRPPFDELDLRRAVALALDEATLARLRDGFLAPSCNMLAPQVPGYRALDPCPFGEREGNADLQGARELVQDGEQSANTIAPVLVRGPADPGGATLARYLVSTLRSIGLQARAAVTPAERAGAQVSFERRRPRTPHPARYLDAVQDPVFAVRVVLLELDGPAPDAAAEWAELDREAVESARVAPYGVETIGTLSSERLDATNCSRVHAVYGLDWSSLCLR